MNMLRQELPPERTLHQPTVIRSIYDAVGQMGFETGNILEPGYGYRQLLWYAPS